ncbi:cholesterol esterase [Coemansia biformis]|uniref:Cholesterol esterase n=1 Tax=Coemansia biformis TaxID=1286918 RepID=A0A9W7YJ40_9FUNG|nr:cholesterol esterase [Coemansia biformis]
MLYIPFFSRLSFSEYQGLLTAALFFVVEKLLRVLLLAFPVGLVTDRLPEWIFATFKVPRMFGADKEVESELLDDFSSFAEIMEYWGYPHEDHLLETRDGFILGTHRITGRRGADAGPDAASAGPDAHPNTGAGGGKPVVLFWHGFMLSSECFVCHPDWINILPFRLAEAGYDVWLGNSRGNKYSYKHIKYVPSDQRFWNFSIDEIAGIDVPTTIDYILQETGAASLTYIGFSQGTTQMFMALSRNRGLNSKVSRFIALAPASTPRGFHNSIVDYFTKATPQMLYLMFGRRRAMSLVYFWVNLLPRDMYVAVLDSCVRLLFGWTMRNLSQETKCIAYWHLYSYTSVKAIVHWMQIIHCGELQMYDEDPPTYQYIRTPPAAQQHPPRATGELASTNRLACSCRSACDHSTDHAASCSSMQQQLQNHSRPSALPRSARSDRIRGYSTRTLTHWNNPYPMDRIVTHISMFHGGSDSLSSVDTLLGDISRAPIEDACFPHYEHMDFLWADSVGTLVYPKVLAAMGIREEDSLLPLPTLTDAVANASRGALGVKRRGDRRGEPADSSSPRPAPLPALVHRAHGLGAIMRPSSAPASAMEKQAPFSRRRLSSVTSATTQPYSTSPGTL